MNTRLLLILLKAFREKLKEALLAVLPVSLIVLLLGCTPLTDFRGRELFSFGICAVFLVIGIALFSLGADLAMTPMGQHIGAGLTRSKRTALLLSFSFLMGLLITVAEPDLAVLADQVHTVMNGTALILAVGAGVGMFLLLAVLKILFDKDLSAMLMFFYMMLFSFAAFLADGGKGAFLPLAFDSGGVTTGPITVPFLMAFGMGIALTAGGRKANENSFGLIALCSVGPVIAVLILSAAATGMPAYTLPDYSMENGLAAVWPLFASTMGEVARSLLLMFSGFLVLQLFILKLPRTHLIQILVGLSYTFAGLVLFLTAVSVGFMPVGYRIGTQLAAAGGPVLTLVCFVLGLSVVLAEPAVHVLKNQVESVTGGEVTRTRLMMALAIGVGISLALSVLRICFSFSILYYLIPGYLLSLGLSFFVPRLYTAIAFDAGGVASGPLTSGFILPLAIGACAQLQGEAEILNYAFGVVAMVAMTPLITIQLLGFQSVVNVRRRYKTALKRILEADDGEIIYFE